MLINNLFTKPLVIICLVLLSLVCLFGYLSFTFYGQKQEIKQSLTLALATNESLNNSLKLQEKACLISDSIAVEFNEESKEIKKEESVVVEKIDRIVSAPKANQEEKPHEANVVDIDGELPLDLRGMLSESCERTKGSSCSHP